MGLETLPNGMTYVKVSTEIASFNSNIKEFYGDIFTIWVLIVFLIGFFILAIVLLKYSLKTGDAS